MLVAGLVAEAAGYLLISTSISFPFWLAGLALDGIGGCAYNAAGKVVIARASTEQNSAASFVGFYVATNVGALLGPLAAALLATASPHAVLALSTVVYVAAAGAAVVRIRRISAKEPQHTSWTAAFEPARNRTFLVYCALTTPLWFGTTLLFTGIPLEAASRGLGYVAIGIINAMNALMLIALGRWIGRRADGRTPRQRTVILCGGAVAMAGGCLLCLPTAGWLLYVSVFVLTFGELALIAAADVLAVQFAPPEATGTYLGYVTTAWAVGGILAGLLAGALLDGSQSGHLLFWTVSAVIIGLDAIAWMIFARRAFIVRTTQKVRELR
jgi:MFS family permease